MNEAAKYFRAAQVPAWRRRLPGLGGIVFALALPACWNVSSPAPAEKLHLPREVGAVHGFPVLRELNGRKLADGEFTQSPDGDRLRIKLAYRFDDDHRIEESAVVQQHPALVQEEWVWEEFRGGKTVRRYAVNFEAGLASADVRRAGDSDRHFEKLRIESGRTFAGFVFTLAIRANRDALLRGQVVELQAIAFTPKPRVVTVAITHAGLDQVPMAGRMLTGERYVIHPKIPWFAKLFIEVPDTTIWLTHPPPSGFLRWEGPLVEPDDAFVRADLLSGDPSGPAKPLHE